MNQADMRYNVTQPISREQQLPLQSGKVLNDIFSSYTLPLYEITCTRRQIGTAESRTNEVKSHVESIYLRDKRVVIGSTPENSLTPYQKSELDQLDAWYKDMLQRPSVPVSESVSNAASNICLPVTASEAEWLIASIRTAFGLTTKDVSAILQVERQTIYAWMRGENQPNEDNSGRLRLFEKYANEWNQLSTITAKEALQIERDGTTLFAELCKEHISEEKVRSLMRDAADYVGKLDEKKRPTGSSNHRPTMSEYDVISLDAFIPNGLRHDD